mmetsp:Transcript_11830/g.31220  ORF Transcript_11830/g.31220 Transcript_11830/m.31220 type:complete len:209 (+) Transcript_11830:760-1386(+)
MHLAVDLRGRRRHAGPQEALLVVLRVQRGGALGSRDKVHRLQGIGAPRLRLLGPGDVLDVKRAIMARTGLRHALRALVVVCRGVLDVTPVVRVSVVVPVSVQHPRMGLIDVRDVMGVPPVEPRGRVLPLERGRQLVVRAHWVRVTVPLAAHVLRLRELDVGRCQTEVAGPAVHRHVVGARTASCMLGVGAAHGEVGFVEVLKMLVVRP